MGIEFGPKVREEADYQNRHLIVGYSLLNSQPVQAMAFCSCGATFVRPSTTAVDNAHSVHRFLVAGDKVVSWAV